MTIGHGLNPKDLYKKVVDVNGQTIGNVVNITQNGNGSFDIFGVKMTEDVAIKVRGLKSVNGHIFLNVDIIERVGDIIKLKNRLDELRNDMGYW